MTDDHDVELVFGRHCGKKENVRGWPDTTQVLEKCPVSNELGVYVYKLNKNTWKYEFDTEYVYPLGAASS